MDPKMQENLDDEGSERKMRAKLSDSEVEEPRYMDPSVGDNLQDEGRESTRVKLRNSEVDEPGYMDPELWENLQHFIPLDMILARLPLREFFQSRFVCKQWNGKAVDRKFLTETNPATIQKPYFHLRRRGPEFQLHGLLSCSMKPELGSEQWNWNYICLGQHDEVLSMAANQGLIYTPRADDSNVLRVFDIHSRIWYTLPQFDPQDSDEDYLPVFALKVDTSQYPYEFRVFRVGGPNSFLPPRSYYSRTNTWSLSDHTNLNDTVTYGPQVSDSTIYFWSDLGFVYRYNIMEDRWDTLNVAEEDRTFESWLTSVGSWKDKVYRLSHDHSVKHHIEGWCNIVIYEWGDETLEWQVFDRMPPIPRDWLMGTPGSEPNGLDIRTSYCNEWVLLYRTYCCEEGPGYQIKHILYNLDTRVGRIAHVPDGLVKIFTEEIETLGNYGSQK